MWKFFELFKNFTFFLSIFSEFKYKPIQKNNICQNNYNCCTEMIKNPKIRYKLGKEEFSKDSKLWQALVAEFIGN